MPTLRQLSVFTEVAKTQNMSHAAKNLYMVQSTVSQTIIDIEKEYNTLLFERISKKLYLTPVGRELLAYSQRILDLYNQMDRDIRSSCENKILRIGASVNAGTYLLTFLLHKLQKQIPNIDPAVVVYSNNKLERMLTASELDVIIVDEIPASKSFLSFPIVEENLVLVCGPKHPFARRHSIQAQELNGQRFVLREQNSGIRRILEDFLSAENITIQTGWICSNDEAVKTAVLENLGISLVSKMLVERELETGSLCEVPIEGKTFEHSFYLAHHSQKQSSDTLDALIHVCRTLHKSKEPLA